MRGVDRLQSARTIARRGTGRDRGTPGRTARTAGTNLHGAKAGSNASRVGDESFGRGGGAGLAAAAGSHRAGRPEQPLTLKLDGMDKIGITDLEVFYQVGVTEE